MGFELYRSVITLKLAAMKTTKYVSVLWPYWQQSITI